MVQVDLFTGFALVTILLLIYHYFAKKYQYFLTKPVPCIKPTFLLVSTGPMLFRKRDVIAHNNYIYYAFPDAKVAGVYDFVTPMYLLRDPEMIKKIGVKDFDYFTDHSPAVSGGTAKGEDEVSGESLFGNSLFALRGQKWRDMRSTLSPAFTGSKMRHMFELVADVGKSVTEYFKVEAKSGKRLEYEMKDTFSRVGTDVIATVAFGMTVDSMRDRENEFYVKGKGLVNFQKLSLFFKIIFMRSAPRLAEKLGIHDILDNDLSKYFKSIILGNMKQRDAHGIVRNDMIHMLMQVQKGALKHQKDEQDAKDAGFATVEESSVGKSTHSRVWTENELVAQCFLFFLAGFDTVSGCMTFLTYELAINPEVQDRLFEEVQKIDQSLNGSPLTYEVLQKMEYMDMVVSETLRKWPSTVPTDRYCKKDYLYDDGAGTKFVIEKGQVVWIPTIAIHNDPKYYPNPEKFDPERFNKENRSKINPGTYLPFGIGPRGCIGSRLALMEVKSVIYYLLKEFRFEPTEKTQIPPVMAKNFALQMENGTWLELKPRK